MILTQIAGEGRVYVYGYAVTPGSELHLKAIKLLNLKDDKKLESDVNIEIPGAEIIDEMYNEWVNGLDTVKKQKEIGQHLNQLGGIELMRAFAYKLIYADVAYESSFDKWHGIGDWQK